jgi:hypothetical protein
MKTTSNNHSTRGTQLPGTKRTTSLLLGLCLAILAVAASPAYARTTTGFSGFRVWENTGSGGTYGGKNPLLCLLETYGAVFNKCKYEVGLEFDLPIDDAGTKSIAVRNYWGGTTEEETFSCDSYAYPGTGPVVVSGTTIDFTGPAQTLTTTVDVAAGSSMQLICKVPPGGGIARVDWTQ